MNKAIVCTKASLQGVRANTRRARLNNKHFQDISFNTDKFISEKSRRVFEGNL